MLIAAGPERCRSRVSEVVLGDRTVQLQDPQIISEFISLGHIVKPRGVKGEFNVLPQSRFFDLLSEGQEVTVIMPDLSRSEKKIRSIRKTPGMAILSFVGIDDRDEAGTFRNAEIALPRKDLPALPEGEYFVDDLIGMTVVTTVGEVLGKIAEVIETGSNDVYSVKGGGVEYLIPAIRDVIVTVDLEKRTILIDPIEGLLEG